jgi:hypothetical protein
MKQKKVLSWFAIGLFPVMMFAQTSQGRQNVPSDPGGWTKAKWGLGRVQIKAVFPQATQVKDANGEINLGISGYLIDVDKYTVTFWFSEVGGLTSVVLDPETKGPSNAVAESIKMDLLEDLTAKYGKPAQVTDDKNDYGGGSTRKWQWFFSKTQITLTWFANTDPDFKHLDKTYLIYSQVRPNRNL